MEQRVSLITLGVSDLARAKAFYEDILGWKAAPGPSEIVFFNLNGVIFSLFPHAELAKDMGKAASADGAYSGCAMAHNVGSIEEVDQVFADLKAKGATIVKAPETAFWGGYSGYFADPDGNQWEVAFNPYWTILEDGRISMEKK
jgi:catechol 2,3-dioxygenase-like lactoylglutathione lyase family enzyme